MGPLSKPQGGKRIRWEVGHFFYPWVPQYLDLETGILPLNLLNGWGGQRMDLILLAIPWHVPSFRDCGQSSDLCPCCVSCVPQPLTHQRSDDSVPTVSRVPHPLSNTHCVWRGLWEGGKEIQRRAIVHQGEGDGFRNCLVKYSREERGCFLLLREAEGGGTGGTGAPALIYSCCWGRPADPASR